LSREIGDESSNSSLCSEDAKAPILCALQAIDEDANFAENVNQLILFDFGEECGGKAADQGN
jgi:hypothetical protein